MWINIPYCWGAIIKFGKWKKGETMRSLHRCTFRHFMVAGIAAASLVLSPSLSWAQAANTPNNNPGQNMEMGQMQHQMMMTMMQQMQGCMEQMGGAGMTDRTPGTQMRTQMMGRMQTCMDRMKSNPNADPNAAGPGRAQTPKNN
jgi:hypothetical protein